MDTLATIQKSDLQLDKEGLRFVSTGIPGLDNVTNGLRLGDNVVLQVSDIKAYISIAAPFIRKSVEEGRKVVYMRFAHHEPIIQKGNGVTVYHIDAENGFESFSTQVHNIITAEGREVFYLFDCLSDLVHSWANDLMIGNFFMITCPYLFKLDTVAYFALYKNSSCFQTTAVIRDTTQVLLDVYESKGRTYVHPLKVWNRHSPTMFLPHVRKGEDFFPITSSGEAAELVAENGNDMFDHPRRYIDFWDKTFMDASELRKKLKAGEVPASQEKPFLRKLCKMVFSREERFLELLVKTFSLDDLLRIKSRMIGSGLIGGKAVGMLLARKMLTKDSQMNWNAILEPHDSFYIGSDVFYTYLVQNGLWKLRMEQKQPENYFKLAEALKEKMQTGIIPENVRDQFVRMLEYFGQSPIIVRSSSLLEDGFGGAFAGKYESVYCANQGTLEERYEQFAKAVRTVFASTMSEDALSYRRQRGLLNRDEQMALLVQRVSGCHRGRYFFPDIAGVGYSYNTYVWDKSMDPKAGVLRLVAGLGTRAVNRVEGDYVRLIALDNPLLKPYAGLEDYKGFSQRKVDLIDLKLNKEQTLPFQELVSQNVDFRLDSVAERDYEAEEILKRLNRQREALWVITFDKLASNPSFSATMQKLLKALEKIYEYPVDIEFTINFTDEKNYRINLLQCRPLQVKGSGAKVEFPRSVGQEHILFRSEGGFMGGNIQKALHRIIRVEPQAYSALCESDRYRVARAVGKLNRSVRKDNLSTMLLGPGRWGTTTSSLGVPVHFAEISNMSVLGEVAYPRAGYAPEVSYGTHFFNDLVENGMFYIALFPERQATLFQTDLLDCYPNIFLELLPDEVLLRDVIRVHDIGMLPGRKLEIAADTHLQQVICHFC